MGSRMDQEVHGGSLTDESVGGVDCKSGDTSGNSTAEEVPEKSARIGESEFEKSNSGSGVVMVGGGDNDASDNQERGGCLEVEEQSCDLGGSCESKEERAELGSRRVVAEVSKRDVPPVENDSFVIDVRPRKGFGESLDGERFCRICHLNSEQTSDTNKSMVTNNISFAANSNGELIMLGCGCKDELGTAHRNCAEAWFRLKGNRFCEVCGETAKNISGVGDNRFMEEWNDRQFIASTSINSSERGGCWRQRSFCNFLMACVVIAFVLPWFFRVNLF